MPEYINQMTTMMQTGEETDDRELDENGDPIINDDDYSSSSLDQY